MKYLDYEGLSQFKDKIDNTYVQQEEGKGLSSNDFTDSLKTKVETAISSKVHLTQAEYDALDDSKLTDGIDYYITDASTESPLATSSTYGVVRPDGETITITDGVLSVIATDTEITQSDFDDIWNEVFT